MKYYITILIMTALLPLSKVNAARFYAGYKVDTSGTCYSAILDTAVNPYSLGIAGNWRPQATYVFYGNRADTNATQDINIRTAGAIAAFVPFWKNQGNRQWKADTTNTPWVWNQQSTIYNVKGFELENTDPLGRYNAGIYGYDNELPVAVVQNARYREVVYDGFEDYGYGMAAYDSACPVNKGFDFSKSRAWFDSTVAHTGKYSLLVPGNNAVPVTDTILATDPASFDFVINRKNMVCSPGTTGLQGIRANSKVIIPSFAPYPGKKMLISAWVKEQTDCNCNQYTNSVILVKLGSTEILCKPTGNIIDGWQRIEQAIDIPVGVTQMKLSFSATGNTAVYFDDIRIHPYDANMQSYVYDPVTLRLMAQLDENNFASFYEYDDDGTLVRVKKETERGIKTIKETRSALIKDEKF